MTRVGGRRGRGIRAPRRRLIAMPETLTLDSVSVLLVWTAIAVYALAFIAYAVDLARARRRGRGREGCRARP